ncbi:MAG: hypothetical protein U0T36_10210 [Saprospiraceae bacterium]|jgi:hypothetical protein
MVESSNSNKLNFELLSWLFALMFAALFIIPIYLRCEMNYTFYIPNIVSIIEFVVLTKMLFLLSYTPYARSKWLRMVLIFLPIPLLMYQVDNLFDFQKFIDEEGSIKFFGNDFSANDYNFGKFIKYQYIFFSVGATIALILVPIRMIISFWRTTNTKHKV